MSSPEWLYEDGVGECRAALVIDGRIVRARIRTDEAGPQPGLIALARLIEKLRARLDDGGEVTLDRAPPGVTLGAAIHVEITRSAIPEAGRVKLPRGRVTDAALSAAPTLFESLEGFESLAGAPVRRLRAHEPDALEAAGWSEVLDEAHGDIAFPGGMLRLSPTPAMTLFDVDGDPPLDALAVRAAQAVAEAIVRHDIGGSIGIDFPTLSGKEPRQAVAAAIDAHLPQPFERTAVNGFGFLQIVRPRPRASLPELLRGDPVGAAARGILRTIERVPPQSSNAVTLAPAVHDWLTARPHLLDELARRTGRHAILTRG